MSYQYTKSGMKRVAKVEDVPSGPHFAVLIYDTQSVYHEGDERSRTHPGHGYPAYWETYTTYEHWVTTDQKVLETFVLELEESLKESRK